MHPVEVKKRAADHRDLQPGEQHTFTFIELGTTELYDTFTGVSIAGPEITSCSQHPATPFKPP